MSDMQSALADTRPLDRPPPSPRLRARSPRETAATTRIDLRATVAGHVIPRLHAALRVDPAVPSRTAGGANQSDEVGAFASRMLTGDVDGACRRVEMLRASGQTLECIVLNVLAPTACRLRDLWSDDACGLADVTVALCNLQAILRRYASPFGADGLETGRRTLILAAVAPCELDLGLPLFNAMLLALFYCREGWQARIECGLSGPMTRAAITGEWFDVVEILIPHETHLGTVASTIHSLRRSSPNPSVGVIVSGPLCAHRPDLARIVGADVTATDPLSSLTQAKRWTMGERPWTPEGSASKPPRRHRLS